MMDAAELHRQVHGMPIRLKFPIHRLECRAGRVRLVERARDARGRDNEFGRDATHVTWSGLDGFWVTWKPRRRQDRRESKRAEISFSASRTRRDELL